MTCYCRDYQKSRVYVWENQFSPGNHIPFPNIAPYVREVWEIAGLKWPPLVEILNARDKSLGKGNRHYVYFPEEGATQLTILHELAHTMTHTIHGHGDAHGPQFVGVYLKLLHRHLDIPLPLLLFTLNKENVDFEIQAKPWSGK